MWSHHGKTRLLSVHRKRPKPKRYVPRKHEYNIQVVNIRYRGHRQARATIVTEFEGNEEIDRWVVIEAYPWSLVKHLYARIVKVLGKCRLVMGAPVRKKRRKVK